MKQQFVTNHTTLMKQQFTIHIMKLFKQQFVTNHTTLMKQQFTAHSHSK